MKLVSVEEMGRAERECGVPVEQLMDNAGLAVAQEAWLLLGELAERRILVLVGPGNNGGDGLVAARHLKDWGADVIVALLKPRAEDDANFKQAAERGVPVITPGSKEGWKRLDEALGSAELIIDALLGTGQARSIEGELARVLDKLREARERRLPPRLLAVDLPTGVDADTGAADPHTVSADHTVTFQWSKVGLHLLPGSRYAGRVEVVDIGVGGAPTQGDASIPQHERGTELLDARWAREALPQRPADAHKGTFGSVLVVGGSIQYPGAPRLSCLGAARSGAGLVTLACARSIYPIVASSLLEVTFEPLDDREGFLSAQEAGDVRRAIARGYEALLVGPGIGQGGYPQAFMRALLPALSEDPLRAVVLDADALNNLSRVEDWHKGLRVPAVITPHPGELSRLTGLEVPEIQADRLGVARKYAEQWGVVLLLKGQPSIVAAPDGRARINAFTTPVVATAGTGDVLAGAIAGFIAQGLVPFDAASLGLYVTSLAAEHLRTEFGSAGGLAGDLAAAIPGAMKELRGESRPVPPLPFDLGRLQMPADFPSGSSTT